jgi:hypothetical protein
LRKIIIVALLFAMVSFSCTPISQTSNVNQYPVAYIDSVNPTSAVTGTSIRFVGHGADRDGTIVGYEWRSNIDGIIANTPTFDYTGLSLGKHAIYFRVQDNKDFWSKEEYNFVEIIPGYTTKPVINEFKVSPEKLSRGESAVLKWDITGATRISISPDIGDVLSSGTRIVFPNVDTTYTLVAFNDNGNATNTTRIAVTAERFKTVDLYAIPSESGSVRVDRILGPNPIVGVQGAGLVWEAFLSFDVSMIPAGAIIRSTSLDLSNHTTVGSPFGLLGNLGVINHQYGTVDGNAFVTTFPTVTMYVGSTDPLQPYTLSTISDAIQQQVAKGSQRFQVRLQFERYYYHADNPQHYLQFYADKTKLSVTYELP